MRLSTGVSSVLFLCIPGLGAAAAAAISRSIYSTAAGNRAGASAGSAGGARRSAVGSARSAAPAMSLRCIEARLGAIARFAPHPARMGRAGCVCRSQNPFRCGALQGGLERAYRHPPPDGAVGPRRRPPVVDSAGLADRCQQPIDRGAAHRQWKHQANH